MIKSPCQQFETVDTNIHIGICITTIARQYWTHLETVDEVE
eukprot:CAMPEP_0204893506 /NCGR_PEP_ID=MMETSP1349-20130617/31654_1 /ASSEMBLY_ACC=CAM_ASM_000710 /TAXON_ID=215587 /ORGANISM="Aplanochytrium stocchinoi, Strain GSBS06" /LENGTH=40 /DNA_ID= /DNA_START= /DNA_END= /DNA_ORIENTATION=